jgi:cytochrome c-type biogenesis protein CcmH/NrfG
VEIPKPIPIEELVLANVNLVDGGVEAFRRKDYAQCIKRLSRALDKNKNDWRARMFLAMAYYVTGATFPAVNHLRYLQERCPDQLVKQKSQKALQALEERVEFSRKQRAAEQHYGAV